MKVVPILGFDHQTIFFQTTIRLVTIKRCLKYPARALSAPLGPDKNESFDLRRTHREVNGSKYLSHVIYFSPLKMYPLWSLETWAQVPQKLPSNRGIIELP